MQLFEFDKTYFTVKPTEEALLLTVFGNIWKRDKTKDKSLALKELAYVWFFCDVKSHFLILPTGERMVAIKKNVGLPDSWQPDKMVNAALDYYDSHKTVIEEMYKGALIVSQTIVKACTDSQDYLMGADDKIAAAQKLNSLLKELPTSMAKLKDAEKQYLKENEEKSGTKKGSQTYNVFEDGLVL